MDTNFTIGTNPHTGDDITVAEVEKLCAEAFKIRAHVDALEEDAKALKEELNKKQYQIQQYLELFGKSKWDSQAGTIEIREKLSVKIPRSEEDKLSLFGWLKDRGIFNQVVSVNSQTLNALYKAEFEASDGLVNIPGIGEPETYKQIVMRKK